MSIYLNKSAHVQDVINSGYSIAQLSTHEDWLTYILGAPSIDDVMSYNSFTTSIAPSKVLLGFELLGTVSTH